MKYELNISATGVLTLAPHPHFTPPLGLTLPAKQDVSVAVPGGKTLGTLFTSCSPALPIGTQVIDGTSIYVWTGSYWMDTGNFTNADAVSITGTVLLRNYAAHDIGVTW